MLSLSGNGMQMNMEFHPLSRMCMQPHLQVAHHNRTGRPYTHHKLAENELGAV